MDIRVVTWTLRSIIESVAGGEVSAASPVASATAFTPESGTITTSGGTPAPQREFCIDNLLVRIHSIIMMMR